MNRPTPDDSVYARMRETLKPYTPPRVYVIWIAILGLIPLLMFLKGCVNSN